MKMPTIKKLFLLALFWLVASTFPALAQDGWMPAETPTPPEPEKGIELLAKRTLNTKTFLNLDSNILTVEVNSGNLHYRDSDGRWLDIDRNLVFSSDSSHYEVTKGPYAAAFPLAIPAYAGTGTADTLYFVLHDSTLLSMRLSKIAFYDTAAQQLITLQHTQASTGVVDGNKITYPEAFTGTDVEFEYTDTALKQRFYLSQTARDSLPTPSSLGLNDTTTFLISLTEFEVPDSLEAYVGQEGIFSRGAQGELILAYEGGGEVVFTNEQSALKFLLPVDDAFGVDAGDSSALPVIRMWRKLYTDEDVHYLISGIPYTWLTDQPAGTVVLDPSVALAPPAEDTYINGNQSSAHGGEDFLRIGRPGSDHVARCLLRFDLSSIPPDATVLSAKLRLYHDANNGPTTIPRTIQVHEALQSWNETQTDWYDRLSEIPWGTAGVGIDDIDVKQEAEGALSWNAAGGWREYSVAALVQRWVSGTDSNYGVFLWATDETTYATGDEKLVRSSEYSTTAYRPQLEIRYSVAPLVEVTYDAENRPVTVAYGNGVTETNTYNPNRGWLTKREYKRENNTVVYSFDASAAGDYDAVGNLKHVSYQHEEDASPSSMDYGYDNLYRITSFSYNSGATTRSYTYDANGNILTFGPKTFSYYANTNRLSSDGSRGFSYDAKGRAAAVAGVTLGYDIFDNMTAHGSHSYTYDAENQRLRKTESGAKRYYLTAGGQVFAEYGNDGALDAEYVYGLGRMLARYSPSEGYRFFYVDHLGSTRRMERDEASPNMRVDYYPYGEALTQGGNDDTPYKFTQKPLDDATGLYYFGARYYDPRIGRFPTVDPLWMKHPEVSPYAYVLNNPIKFFDPDGSAPKSVIRTGYAGVVFDKYLRVRNEVISTLNQVAAEGGIVGFGASLLSKAIDSFTPNSLAEQWNNSALGLLGTTAGIGTGSKLLKAADNAADLGTDVVRHYTNDAGKKAITKSGVLKEGTYVTRPGDVPTGASAKEVESFLEIKPGKGENYIDVQLKPGQLKVPPEGGVTSGGAVQRQTTKKVIVKPEDFKRTEN